MANPAQRLEADLQAYPGMLVDETVVWRAWALLHQGEYDRFDHNLRLGPARDPGPAFLPSVRKAEMLNSQMRVDSVGWQGIDPAYFPADVVSPQQIYDLFPSAEVTIFEVKRRATLAAYGEIMGYNHGWLEEFKNVVPPRLIIVCAEYAQTILPATRASNVQVDIVQANFTILSTSAGTMPTVPSK
jgi:hypothetical protein